MPILGVIASSAKGAPGIPTSVSATDVGTARAYNNGAATVSFTPGTGATATSFTATSSPGGFTATGASSPLTVAGLQSNTAYTFTVTATNASGTSAASSASASITATTVPQAPTIGTPTCATGQAYTGSANISVAFTAGATGGKAISSFTATSSSSATGSGASSPIAVSQTVGSSYTYTVTATNANGTSTASGTSASVLAASVPQAPTIGTATGGNASATVTYTANATGGSAITTFTATSSPGSITGTGASPITVSGLTNGTAYTFTVTATNAYGTSAASAASNSVTPAVPFAYNSISSYLTPTTPTGWGTLTSGGSFNSIPQTYRHLQFRISGQSNTSSMPDQWYFYINNDFSTRFSEQTINGVGGNPQTSLDSINRINKIESFPVGNTSSTYRDTHILTYFNYTDTSKIKIIRYEYFSYNPAGTYIRIKEATWINTSTAAISSFQFGSSLGDPVAGCTFALYGIS